MACQCTKDPCTCCDNFWITSTGINTLKGCECDPCNPPFLPVDTLLEIYYKIPKAKEDFWKLYPSLFPCEKEKFDKAFEKNPWATKYELGDDMDIEDAFQKKMNTGPIYAVTLYTTPKQPIQNIPKGWPGCK